MTNILIVGGLKSHPATTGGHVHTVSFARALAHLGYNVRLFGLAGRRENYVKGRPTLLIDSLEERLEEHTCLSLKTGILQNVFRKLGLPHLWQYVMLERALIPDSLRSSLDWADAIIYNHSLCPPSPGPWATKPKFMLSHNLEYRLLELGPLSERLCVNWLKRVEERAVDRYDDIFVCAEDDYNFFRARSSLLALPRVSTGIHPGDYGIIPESRDQIRRSLRIAPDEILVLFTGSNFGPNLEAYHALRNYCAKDAGWLTANRIKIVVVGSLSNSAFTEGPLVVTGRVPEIHPFFAAADVGLNPVTTGSGSNVKLFEYLAAKLPVISTVFGVRGTALQPGQDFIEFNSANPREAFENLVAKPIQSWTHKATTVWERHQDSLDMVRIVSRATSLAVRFPQIVAAQTTP